MLSPLIILSFVAAYFLLLVVISKIIERKSDERSFFTGNRSSPWYLVAFGMIGASLSGVTFVSVPGAVAVKSFSYFQMVLGFTVGYIIIALVLLPLYYRLNLTSIYSYLDQRFGRNSQLVGALFFLLSRVIGASLRMYLVVLTLQTFVFDQLGIHFTVTIAISLALIWIYTSKAGIKTIVYTDTLQTAFMLLSLCFTIYFILDHFNFDFTFIKEGLDVQGLTKTFFTNDISASNTFWKQFLGGAVIALAMTGLDQDMMQKNLTCPSIKEAQKNVYAFSTVLVFVNALFLIMGALLVFYMQQENIAFPLKEDGGIRTDLIFPTLALEYFSPVIGIIFLLGLIAAAYSSADSALTALTTSYCFDIMKWSDEKVKLNKTKVHIGFSVVLFFVISIFYLWNNDAAIFTLFRLAGYTYGPLLGLFFFGILTNVNIKDQLVPYACILSPIICYGLDYFIPQWTGYSFGMELLLINGVISFCLLFMLKSGLESKPKIEEFPSKDLN